MTRASEARAARPLTARAPGVWESLERVAETDPGRAALTEYHADGASEEWSYERLHRFTLHAAAELRGRSAPGEVVLLDNAGGARQIAWMLAAVREGRWVLPVPMQTTTHELEQLATATRATLVIGPERRLEHCDWLDSRVELTEPTIESTGLSVPSGGIVLVTSGTTGQRKLVRRDASALDADGRNILAATSLTEADRVLLAISLSHSYAIDLILGSVLAGATLEVVPTFDLGAIASRLAGGATVFPGVPFLFEGLTPRWEGRGNLRLTFSAGSRMPCSTRLAFTQATGLPIGDLYGATELGTVIFRDPSDGEPESGLIGRELPGVSVRVLEPGTRRALGPGVEGELAIRSPSMLCGDPGGPANLVDGHFRTGDLGRVDEHGRVFLAGRLKFVIEAGGLKLNPVELEAILETHPRVRECLVSPMPASATITRIKATIVPEPGETPTEAELRAFLRERVGPAKIPRRFEFVEALPKSSTGKLIRPSQNGAST